MRGILRFIISAVYQGYPLHFAHTKSNGSNGIFLQLDEFLDALEPDPSPSPSSLSDESFSVESLSVVLSSYNFIDVTF